jgi:hypothetical protein
MTTRLPRLGTLVVLGSLIGACSQLIGLNDFDEQDGTGGENEHGTGGNAAKGGAGGSSGNGTSGTGTSAGGAAGSATQGGIGGTTAGQGGTGARGGKGGSGAVGGDGAGEGGAPHVGGKGGSGAVGGTTGGTGMLGGAGGEPSYDCVSTLEITTGVLLATDDPSNYAFAVDPQIGNAADDELWIDFYGGGEYDGERVGTFDLGMPPDDNYATCSRCVWFGQDLGTVSEPRARFYVRSGTLTVDPESLQMEGYPIFTLDDVLLVESNIDVGDTNVSEPVPNPRCLHLGHASISMPAAPSDWTCDPTYYGTGDGCDCGCGILDPDCSSQYGGACEACADDGGCGTDADYCFGIDPDNNALCTEMPAWVCSPAIYGDGQSCDCGCGVTDIDCASSDVSVCDSCADVDSCDHGDCATIDPANNGVCLP